MINYYCAWKQASKAQRTTEINRGEGLLGTQSYADRGCYSSCPGLNQKCEGYFNKNVVKIELLNKQIKEAKLEYMVN